MIKGASFSAAMGQATRDVTLPPARSVQFLTTYFSIFVSFPVRKCLPRSSAVILRSNRDEEHLRILFMVANIIISGKGQRGRDIRILPSDFIPILEAVLVQHQSN